MKNRIICSVLLQGITFNIGKSTAVRKIEEGIFHFTQQSRTTNWGFLHKHAPIQSKRNELNLLHVIHMFSNIESALNEEHLKINNILSKSVGGYLFISLKIKQKSDIPALFSSHKEKLTNKTTKLNAARKMMRNYPDLYYLSVLEEAQKSKNSTMSDMKSIVEIYKLPDNKFQEFMNYFNELDNMRQDIVKTQNALIEILQLFIQKPSETWAILEMYEGTIFTCADTIEETIESKNIEFFCEEILKPIKNDILHFQDESINMRFHSAKSRLEQEAQFLKLLQANRQTFSELKSKTLDDLLVENEKIQKNVK